MQKSKYLCNFAENFEEKSSKVILNHLLTCGSSALLWESNKIFVQVLPQFSIQSILEEHSIPYSEFTQFGSNPYTYLVTLNGLESRSIEFSNVLYEGGKVAYAQPSFWRELKKLNNPFYHQQWGLNNTGQNGGRLGVDINAVKAWQLSTGSGIKVAVIDEGVDLTHPDLINNILPGYDATNRASEDIGVGYKGNDAHGTACAGIIAAEDNNIGVKGVAYNAKIIPIRIAYSYNNGIYTSWFSDDSWVVNGLKKAWYDFGADVLSNSWGYSWDTEAVPEAVVSEINNALAQGRNGKGAVIAFASGNDDISSISYPANLEGVIAVGAMSPCGERKSIRSCDTEDWGSNYGAELSVVAPGVLVPTVDIQGNLGYNPNTPIHINIDGSLLTSDFIDTDYTVWFNGTSAACPYVAGVAALILSINPELTSQEVTDVIEKTARKVRSSEYSDDGLYLYENRPNYPNGTWNEQMGYGLVDAYAAVKMAKTYHKTDFLVRDNDYDRGGDIEILSLLCNDCSSPDINLLNLSFQKIKHLIRYNSPNCYVAVDIKNIGGKTHTYSGKEKLYLYWYKPVIGSQNSEQPYTPPTFNEIASNPVSISQSLASDERKVAAGVVNWELPDFRLKLAEASYFQTDIKIFNPTWGFSIMAIADEGTDPEFTALAEDPSRLSITPEQFAYRHNSVAISKGGSTNKIIILEREYCKLMNIRPILNQGFELKVNQLPNVEDLRLSDFAELYVVLSNDLVENLIENENVKRVEHNIVQILSPEAVLSFNPIQNPNGTFIVGAKVNFISDLMPEYNEFDFDLIYSEAKGAEEYQHAMRFTAVRDEEAYFKAQAEASETVVVKAKESVTLTSNTIFDEATYTWTDENGEVIGEGYEIEVTPEFSQNYKVEIERTSDGYKSYGEVRVEVVNGKIEILAPNPATSEVKVAYILSDNVPSASIQISDMQNIVNLTYPIYVNETEKMIPLGSLAPGVYFVKLLVGGQAIDSKQLIVN